MTLIERVIESEYTDMQVRSRKVIGVLQFVYMSFAVSLPIASAQSCAASNHLFHSKICSKCQYFSLDLD